jgi:hypothetical protein
VTAPADEGDDGDDHQPRALVKAGPPRLELARSLETATPRSLVYIDATGEVRSPARFRTLNAIAWGSSAVISAAAAGVYVALLGAPGLLVGAGLGLFYGLVFHRARLLRQGMAHVSFDRLDEGEALLKRVTTSRISNKNVRAMAWHGLARVAAQRGDHEAALAHLRTALGLHARFRRRPALARLTEYAEIVTLVNLDRVAEARQRLDGKRPVPTGNYLKLQHWVAELYVCFAEGAHRLDGDALHERARAALGISNAAALLALCAWAHEQAGDRDQAEHLLAEAFDRREGLHLDRALPRLHAWMETRRAAGATKDVLS